MPDIDPAELQKFGDAIARPSVRKTFQQDPYLALERAGVDVKKLQPEVLDLFADLSSEELDVISRVAERANRIPGIEQLRDHVGVIIH